jgi:hypothetical protein
MTKRNSLIDSDKFGVYPFEDSWLAVANQPSLEDTRTVGSKLWPTVNIKVNIIKPRRHIGQKA